jgi:hypothetical protein
MVTEKACINCLRPVTARANTRDRGPDIAWYVHCRECSELVTHQMELADDHAMIQIYRCRVCGTERACRPGWLTRCHVCLDERTSPDHDGMRMGRQLLADLAASRVLGTVVRRSLGLRPGQRISVGDAAEFVAAQNLEYELEAYRRPGWTILAGDIHGLPWFGERRRTPSHGTWARHDTCGHVQKLTKRRAECANCPPEPGSRTHRARKDDPYLLYLVGHGRLQKFGRGYPERVDAHLRCGARVIQVLSGRHEDVVAAENALKRRYRAQAALSADLPATFGSGTEVISRRVRVELATVLPTGDDVTARWLL